MADLMAQSQNQVMMSGRSNVEVTTGGHASDPQMCDAPPVDLRLEQHPSRMHQERRHLFYLIKSRDVIKMRQMLGELILEHSPESNDEASQLMGNTGMADAQIDSPPRRSFDITKM